MNEKKMTIHRALSELKLIDAKIEKQTLEIYPTSILQKGKKIDGHLTEEEFKSNAQGKFDSVTALIDRKVAIKSAIVKSNGVTTVVVGGKEMTVSSAITFKSIIDLKKKLALVLKQKYIAAVSKLNQSNDLVNKNVEVLLANAFGKEQVKATKDDVDAVSKPYLDNNTFHLIDPLKCADKIEALEKEIGEFETDVDAVLSESNAVTFIEI